MAGDWIKMRASLSTHPKVTAMAKLLENDRSVSKSLATGFGGALREIVTRNVTRDVTLASLFRVWCAANEHTADGVWHGIELDDLDHVAGVPGFGRMMEAVGWAVFDADNNTVIFPNFLEYNAPAKEGRDKGAAERQRRYRERQRQSDADSNVTRNVTLRATRCAKSDVEREKRREENNTLSHADPKNFLDHPEFAAAWDRWGRHLLEQGKPMTPTSSESQLYQLADFSVEEAIAMVGFSISRNARNLITNGDHKRPAVRGSPSKRGPKPLSEGVLR